MKPKTLILMVLAIGCGLGASFMTSRLLAERNASDDEEKVPVVFTKKRLDVGYLIKKEKIGEYFEIKLTPKEVAPKDAITKLEDLNDRVLKKTLTENVMVTELDAIDKRKNQVIDIPKGHVAVGLRVNMESSASGFSTLPGNRVDIIGTFRRATDKTTFSRVLLSNVLVLASDDRSQPGEEKKAMPAQVVTFALTPEQALQINMAKELGTLSLALRSPGDTDVTRQIGIVTAAEVFSGRRSEEPEEIPETKPSPVQVVEAPPAPVKKAEPKTIHKLHIIEGDKERVTEYVIEKNGKVADKEVIRTELTPSAPQTPAPAPPAVAPQTTPPPPPAPAPRKDESVDN